MIRLVWPDGRSQKLRWSDQHPASSYGLGVLLLGRRGEILSGAHFMALATEGARIECGSDLERRRAAGALAWEALGLPAQYLKISEK